MTMQIVRTATIDSRNRARESICTSTAVTSRERTPLVPGVPGMPDAVSPPVEVQPHSERGPSVARSQLQLRGGKT